MNSSRNKPTPSAPREAARVASPADPMLASKATRVPSRVSAGCGLACAGPSSPSGAGSAANRAAASGGGLTVTRPSDASTSSRSPSRIRVVAPATLTTAGMPSDAAKMAACEAGPPPSVTIAATWSGSMSATSAGVISLATTTISPSGGAAASGESPRQLAARRRPSPRISAARSRR